MQYNKIIYKFSRAKSEALVNILKFYFKENIETRTATRTAKKSVLTLVSKKQLCTCSTHLYISLPLFCMTTT